tara:strand:- start:60 stop:206 length:147 start_codon:yes stop_codon:yes gene_type:complete
MAEEQKKEMSALQRVDTWVMRSNALKQKRQVLQIIFSIHIVLIIPGAR